MVKFLMSLPESPAISDNSFLWVDATISGNDWNFYTLKILSDKIHSKYFIKSQDNIAVKQIKFLFKNDPSIII